MSLEPDYLEVYSPWTNNIISSIRVLITNADSWALLRPTESESVSVFQQTPQWRVCTLKFEKHCVGHTGLSYLFVDDGLAFLFKCQASITHLLCLSFPLYCSTFSCGCCPLHVSLKTSGMCIWKNRTEVGFKGYPASSTAAQLIPAASTF